MINYLRHIKRGKVTKQHQMIWLTFFSFQKSELPQVGFEPTSMYSLDQCATEAAHCNWL